MLLRNAVDAQFTPVDPAAAPRETWLEDPTILNEASRKRVRETMWVSHLHRAFPAGTGDRAEVAALMSSLVPFRNRLAHHETIMRRPILGHYEEMLTLAGLIDPSASAWIRSVSRVEQLIAERPSAR